MRYRKSPVAGGCYGRAISRSESCPGAPLNTHAQLLLLGYDPDHIQGDALADLAYAPDHGFGSRRRPLRIIIPGPQGGQCLN